MNPWLAAALAAGALWLVNHGRQQQAQADAASAGHQAGAGETSDQGGGSFMPFGGEPVQYQGGVTQPVTSVSYQPPSESGGSSSGSGSGSEPSSSSYYGSAYSPPGYVSTPTGGGGYINPAYNRLPGSPVSALISNPYNDQFPTAASASQPTRSGAQL